jgi:hypothetical protein
MQGGAGVGHKKSDARIPSEQRCLSTSATLPILNGFDQDPANLHRCFLAFLPGSGLRVEFAVTHSKQTAAPFLPGSRIASCHARSSIANALSNRELQLLEPRLTHRKQTIARRSNRELSTNRCRGNSHAVIPILTFLTGLPRAFFAKGSVCTSTFLTGSASQTEFAVTHSKQTTASFLTGSRIVSRRFAKRAGLFQEAGEGLGGDEFGDFDVDLGALTLLAADVHFELIAVEQAEAFVNVADADASAVNFGEALGGDAHSIVFDFDEQPAIHAASANVDFSSLQTRGEAVLDGIFDHGLKQHAGNESVESVFVNFLENLQLVAAEADDFDVEVIVDEFEFFAQRDERFVLAKQAAQDVGELQDHAAGHVRVETDQRRNCVERVEKKMRIDLAGERVHARFQQELLILLQVHLDARVVPDFYGHGDAHHRRKHHQQRVAQVLRMEIKEPIVRNDSCEFQLRHREHGAGEKRQHRPISLGVAHEAPDPFGDTQEEERAEMPDVFFFRHQFTDDAGKKAHQCGCRARKPFVIAESGKADQRAAEQADDSAADQAHQERAFEREVEEAVSDYTEPNANSQRRGEEKQQHHFLVGVANFGEKHAAERTEAHQKSGERGCESNLQHQREQQVLSAKKCAHFARRVRLILRVTLAKAGSDVKSWALDRPQCRELAILQRLV